MALFLAVGSASLYYHPLTTDRPDFTATNSQTIGDEDVDARLWQDPLEAVSSEYHPPTSWTETTSIDISTGSKSLFNGKVQLGHYQGDALSTESACPHMGTQSAADGLTKSPREPGSIPLAKLIPPPRHSLREIQDQIIDTAQVRGESTLILPVMVQGDAYPEIAERRIRTRVAVLEALGIRGYKPDDTVHLGYFTMGWPSTRMTELPRPQLPDHTWAGDLILNLVIPYEWCEAPGVPMAGVPIARQTKGDTAYKKVLVLWVNENVFYDFPMTRLGWLLQSVIPRGVNANVRIIGPCVSTTLRAMVEEAEAQDYPDSSRPGPFDSFGRRGSIEIMSPWATASDEALFLDEKCSFNPRRARESVSAYLSRGFRGNRIEPFRFVRTTLTDSNICDELAAELYRRNVDLPAGKFLSYCDESIGQPAASQAGEIPPIDAESHGYIALIGEWDTVFGRALSFNFVAAATGRRVAALTGEAKNFPAGSGHLFICAASMGRLQEPVTAAKPLMPQNPERRSEPASNWAVPRSRRKGWLNRTICAAWRINWRNGMPICGAMGIILPLSESSVLTCMTSCWCCAVRDRLSSGVVYFTTDLDARYNLPSEWRTTHNLLVASGFGLRLHRYYQGNIPPFRDSLQTAGFAATVAAVDPAQMEKGGWRQQLGLPRVYEIGRTEAFDMSVDRASQSEEGGEVRPYSGEKDRPSQIQPPRQDLKSWWDQGEGAAICFAIYPLLWRCCLLYPSVSESGRRSSTCRGS